MDIVTSILLLEGHGFLSQIHKHISRFDNYKQKWRKLAMTKASLEGEKWAYHLQFLALRLSKYWRAQRRLLTSVALGNPSELINMIEIFQQWETTASHSLVASFKIDILGCAGQYQGRFDLYYVDIFVEIFALLVQAPNTRRVRKTLLHTISHVF